MTQYDFSLDELRSYRPHISEPADFDEFWHKSLAHSRAKAKAPVLTESDSMLPLVSVHDMRFSGFDGQEVAAWLIMPRTSSPLPAVVTFCGYGGGRGLPLTHLSWAAAGYAHIVMDTRGQGSVWGRGITPDLHPTGPAYPGVMTRGVENRDGYYYRRVFVDAVLAVDAARELPQVDASRVVVAGESQGGGIALAAAALSDGLLAALVDVPFLCHFQRAVTIASDGPYRELVNYLATHRGEESKVMETLGYFDGINMARRMKAQAMFSVALMDTVCPPSSVFAAYNACGSPQKEIAVYPFNGHEGGKPDHWLLQAKLLAELIGRSDSPYPDFASASARSLGS